MRNEKQTIGAVLGMVTGDCVGGPYVFMKSAQLFDMSRQISWQVHPMGVNSQLMMAGMQAIYRHGFVPDALVRHYYQRLNQTMVEPDMVSSRFFAQTRKSAAHLYVMAIASDHGALCSGQLLIRQLPVILSGMGLSAEIVSSRIATEARLTHTDPDCIEYAQMYGLCMRGILLGHGRSEIWDQLFATVQSPAVYRTLLSSYYEKPVCDASTYSHAGITLQLALYHYWHDTPFVSAIRSAALSGGATDVNCAAVGGLLGASQGIETIPSAWREILLNDTSNKRALRRTIRYAAAMPQYIRTPPKIQPMRTMRMDHTPSSHIHSREIRSAAC